MRNSKTYRTAATWFCVSLFLLIGSLNSFATVLCFHPDGSVGFENGDGLGNCSPCSESGETKDSEPASSSENCLDLPISSIAGVPVSLKLSPPALRIWPSLDVLLSYSSWITQALQSTINNALYNFHSDFHLRSSNLHIARSVLLLI